jgi:hypothetical protein
VLKLTYATLLTTVGRGREGYGSKEGKERGGERRPRISQPLADDNFSLRPIGTSNSMKLIVYNTV